MTSNEMCYELHMAVRTASLVMRRHGTGISTKIRLSGMENVSFIKERTFRKNELYA